MCSRRIRALSGDVAWRMGQWLGEWGAVVVRFALLGMGLVPSGLVGEFVWRFG